MTPVNSLLESFLVVVGTQIGFLAALVVVSWCYEGYLSCKETTDMRGSPMSVLTPDQLKQIGRGFLAYADEHAGLLQHKAIQIAQHHLDATPAADLAAWFQSHGYLPVSELTEEKTQ